MLINPKSYKLLPKLPKHPQPVPNSQLVLLVIWVLLRLVLVLVGVITNQLMLANVTTSELYTSLFKKTFCASQGAPS